MEAPQGISKTAVTVVTAAVLALLIWFFFQVMRYYRQISAGQVPELPQFSGQASIRAGASSAGSPAALAVGSSDDPSIGPADAKLTIVEFVDYQCPFSTEVSGAVRELAAAYGDRVRFVIRDYPITELHADAIPSAEAAGCAEVQGKYWAMHDRLFALKGALSRRNLDQAARQAGLDFQAFSRCMEGHERLKEIEEDLTAGSAAGVRGTPTFFFNGRKAEGSVPRDVFEKIIEELLKSL
jgi:protein-disulfide isomerase